MSEDIHINNNIRNMKSKPMREEEPSNTNRNMNESIYKAVEYYKNIGKIICQEPTT